MNLIFAGTPEFAACALRDILAAGHQVALVLTQPDRPAGRGMALQASPVKRLALEHGLRIFQPPSLRDPEAQGEIAAIGADIMVVVAYGLILPQAVLDLPRWACINIHASLLPRWRGAAPIQRAILAGDTQTGVCIMQMEAGLDTGPVLACESLEIGTDETAGSLHDRLATLGGTMTLQVLAQWPLPAQMQPEAGVTYAAKIDKSEAVLDWRDSAEALNRRIRAFNPFPGTQVSLAGQGIKIWLAQVTAGQGEPGEILAADRNVGLVVATGSGALRILELQKAGGKRVVAGQYLSGSALQVGQRFDLIA